MTEKIRILLIGATGYIGGSVLTELIDRGLADQHHISALVRQPYQASILTDAGIEPVIFKDLDDFDNIREAAKDHDIVVACANARHPGCAHACILGLSDHQKATGRRTSYIHTSGTSMVGDWPISGDRIDNKVYSDINDDIFEVEKTFPDSLSPVRKVDQLVVELGEKEGVDTYIVPPPLIFGPGTGSFTLGFGQVHMVAQMAIQRQQAVMIGAGSGIWNRVHISDLSNLFGLLIRAIMDQKPDLTHGKKGFYFAENGDQSWKYISERIAKTGKLLVAFETEEIGQVTLQEAADEFYDGDLRHAEAVLASNSRTKADRARQVLGWEPKYDEDCFLAEIDDIIINMLELED